MIPRLRRRYVDCYPSHDTLAALSGRSVSNGKTALKMAGTARLLSDALAQVLAVVSASDGAGGDAPTKDELRERASGQHGEHIQFRARHILCNSGCRCLGEAYPKQITHILPAKAYPIQAPQAYPIQAVRHIPNRLLPIELRTERDQ